MSIEAYYIIVYVQTALSALIAIFAFAIAKQGSYFVKPIGLLFASSFVCNALALVVHHLHINLPVNVLGSVYDIIFVSTTILIYERAFGSRKKGIFMLVAIVFSVGAVVNLIFFQQLSIASYTKFAGSFIIIILITAYFYKLLVELPTVHLHTLPMFWISSALLVYSAGAIFLYAFTDYLINVMKDNMILYWSFHNLLFILQDILLCIGLKYELDRQRKNPATLKKSQSVQNHS